MKTYTYTDGTGFTEDEWERMWNSESATSTVARTSDDDDDAWQALYDRAIADGASDEDATEYADANS